MPWEGLWIPVAQALADRRHVEREESRPPITDDDVRWLQREVGPTSLKTWVLAGAPFSDSSTASSSPTFAANRTASPPAPEPQQRDTKPAPNRQSRTLQWPTVPQDAVDTGTGSRPTSICALTLRSTRPRQARTSSHG